jgi:hypothetical protein
MPYTTINIKQKVEAHIAVKLCIWQREREQLAQGQLQQTTTQL